MHDHFISGPLARRTKLYSVLFPLRQKYIHWLFRNYVMSCKESTTLKGAIQRASGYFNRKKFVVSLTPESRSDVSHAGIFAARCSFFFVHGALSYNVSSDVEIARFFLGFHGKCCK